MVIESPQQYKSLAEIEAESEAGGGSQVAAAATAAVSERWMAKRSRDPPLPHLLSTSNPNLHTTSLEMMFPNKPLIAEDAALKIIF